MASDIPEAAHRDTHAMARALASYIDCPKRIRSAILGEFSTSPGITTLERYIREAREPVEQVPPAKAHDGYYPADAAEALKETNRRFLMRIEIERAINRSANRDCNVERAA